MILCNTDLYLKITPQIQIRTLPKIVLTYLCRGISIDLAAPTPEQVGGLWTRPHREPRVILPGDHVVEFVCYTCYLPGGVEMACREVSQTCHQGHAANCDLFPSPAVLFSTVAPHLGCRRYGL